MDDLEAQNQAWERLHNPSFMAKKPKSVRKQQKEPKPDTQYADLSYNELKHLVAVKHLKPKGRKKADLLAALKA